MVPGSDDDASGMYVRAGMTAEVAQWLASEAREAGRKAALEAGDDEGVASAGVGDGQSMATDEHDGVADAADAADASGVSGSGYAGGAGNDAIDERVCVCTWPAGGACGHAAEAAMR